MGRRRHVLTLGLWALCVMLGCTLCACSSRIFDLLGDDVESEQVTEPEASAPTVDVTLYHDTLQQGIWYQALSERERELYVLMVLGLQEGEEAIELGPCEVEEIQNAYLAIKAEHPELFWLKASEYHELDGNLTFVPNSELSAEETADVLARINQAADEALAGLSPDASTYDKVRYCYEWIIENTNYGNNDHDQTIQGVLLDHEAVCAGYTQALQFLLQRLEIPCDQVSGTVVDRGSHAWNIVWIDGTPTCVDVTWGDPLFAGEDGSLLQGDEVSYDYLCVTTDEINRIHVLELPATGVPQCDSTAYDYYRLTGTYLESFDVDALQQMVAAASEQGTTSLRFKLGSAEAYAEAEAFVSSQDVFWILPGGVEGISLSVEEELYIIGIEWF